MDSSSENSAFDRYLDAVLAGRIVTPDEFRINQNDPGGELDEACERLHQMLVGGSATRTGGAIPAADNLDYEAIGDFRLIRELGRGGMGIVYLAEQMTLGRLVALKVLPAAVAGSPTASERFRREARAAAKLRHDHIVRLLEFGEADGVHYIAMDFVAGRSADDIVATAEEGPEQLGTPKVLRWGTQIAGALQTAHEAGIIHRDIKPGNVLIDANDNALLLDFGLAKNLVDDQATLTTFFAGSPRYAAPEQMGAHGGRIDARTDVYGLGITLYELLCRQAPFHGDSMESLAQEILHQEPPPLRSLVPGIPLDLESVVMKAIEKDPDHRYQSAQEFRDDLVRIKEFRPVLARPPGWATRLVRWRKRNRALANSAFAIGLVICAAIAWQVWNARKAGEERLRQARSLVASAQTLLDDYESQRMPYERTRWRLASLTSAQDHRRLTADEARERDSLGLKIYRLEKERDIALADAEEALSAAEELAPNVEGLADGRAHLYHEKWLDHRRRRDGPLSAYYRELALKHGKDPKWTDKLASASPVSIKSNPPGAEIFLFKVIEQTRLKEEWPASSWDDKTWERRIVPSPCQSAVPPIMPGARCWRVMREAGPFETEDIIPASPGEGRPQAGSNVRVWRNGQWLDLTVPGPMDLVITRTPILISPAARIGTTPLLMHLVEAGEYVAVLRKAGFEDVRLSFHVDYREDPYHQHGHADMSLDLWPQGATEEGFVRVCGEVYDEKDCGPFAIMRHEVTCGEYLTFLNDEQTRRKIAAADKPAFVPRSADGSFLWQGDDKTGFSLPKESKARQPVTSISHSDALAFAEWRTNRSKRGGSYSLPNRGEWLRSTFGGESRVFAFGNYFRQDWVHSRYAAADITLQNVMTFERDESVFGAFDMSGSVSEWLESADMNVQVAGGSYLDSMQAAFKNASTRSVSADEVRPWIGFRLVWRSGEGGK